MSVTSSIMSEPSNRGDLAYETFVSPEDNNKCQSCKSNSIMNNCNCKRTKDMHTIHLDTDESTAPTEDETDDESLRLGPGFGSLYLTSNSSLSDTGTYNSSPLDPTRVRSSSGLTSINEVVDRVAADREVWRRKSLLVDNDDDQYNDYPSDEEGGIKSSLAKKLSYGDAGRDTSKRIKYLASFHCSTKLETNSSFEEPLTCREKFDQPALGCDENLCSPSRRKEPDYDQMSGEPENEWVGRLLVSGFYNMMCGTRR